MLKMYTVLFLIRIILSNKISSELAAYNAVIFRDHLNNIIRNSEEHYENIIITTFNYEYEYLDSPVIITDIRHLYLIQNLKGYSKNVIIAYENISKLNETLQILQTFCGFKNFRLFLLFRNVDNNMNLIEMFNLIWRTKNHNVIALINNNNNVTLLGLDYDNWNCRRETNNGLLDKSSHEVVFPTNLYKYFIGCPFKVIWSTFPPWVLKINSSYPGVHIEMMNLFKIASKFDLLYMPENQAYMDELKNGYIFDSILNDFNTEYADVYVGLASFFGSVPVEKTFITDNKLYFAMPKPRQISYWNTVFLIFNLKYCILMGVIMLIMAIALTGFSKESFDKNVFGNFYINIFHSYAISLGMSIHKVFASLRLRILICKFGEPITYRL